MLIFILVDLASIVTALLNNLSCAVSAAWFMHFFFQERKLNVDG